MNSTPRRLIVTCHRDLILIHALGYTSCLTSDGSAQCVQLFALLYKFVFHTPLSWLSSYTGPVIKATHLRHFLPLWLLLLLTTITSCLCILILLLSGG